MAPYTTHKHQRIVAFVWWFPLIVNKMLMIFMFSWKWQILMGPFTSDQTTINKTSLDQAYQLSNTYNMQILHTKHTTPSKVFWRKKVDSKLQYLTSMYYLQLTSEIFGADVTNICYPDQNWFWQMRWKYNCLCVVVNNNHYYNNTNYSVNRISC